MKRLLATLAALLLASSAHAFTISSVQIQPGFFTAGVRVFCAGTLDTTQTITCQLYIRRLTGDQGVFSQGTTCIRRTGFTNAFDGIFIGLTPGQDYVARVVVNATGQSEKLLEQSFTTRSYVFSCPGPQVFVSPSGTDAGGASGCTSGSPCKTIDYAEQSLTARANQGQGGAIVLRPGVYRQATPGWRIQWLGRPSAGQGAVNGTPNLYYHLMGDGTNPDSTIIDGSEEHTQTWVARGTAGDSCFATKPLNTYGGAITNTDSILCVVRGWGEWIPKKESLAGLLANKNLAVGEVGMATGVTGWVANATKDSIIVKVPSVSGTTPPAGTETWHWSYRTQVTTNAPYWAISNLTIRNWGQNGNVEFGLSNSVSGSIQRGNGGVLDSVKIIGGNGSAYLNHNNTNAGGAAGWQDSILIRNCLIDGLRGSVPYASVAGLAGHGHAVQYSCGFANTVYNCTLTGHLYGYEQFNDDDNGGTIDTVEASDNYFGYNRVIDNICTGIDVNAYPGVGPYGAINHIYENNLIRNRPIQANDVGGSFSGSGITMTPAQKGPQWLIRNHVYGTTIPSWPYGGGIVMASTGGQSAMVVLYNNTISGGGTSLKADAAYNGRIISRNNIYAAKKDASSSDGQDAIFFNNTNPAAGQFDFDYDMISTTAKNAGSVRWGFDAPYDRTVAQQQAFYGNMLHSFDAAFTPVDSTRTSSWPAAVTSGSAANVDKGVVIPGINTQLFGKPRYYGSAPDIGAYEWIAPTDSLHMPLNPNNRLWIKK